MESEPVLTLAEITWLLSSHRGKATDLPELTADRLVKLGLVQRKPGAPATISDAGRNWLARNGHLRSS